MKKLLIILGAIVMSCGAFANTIHWNVSISGIPSSYEMPSDTVALLIDKTKTVGGKYCVLAYATYDEVSANAGAGSVDVTHNASTMLAISDKIPSEMFYLNDSAVMTKIYLDDANKAKGVQALNTDIDAGSLAEYFTKDYVGNLETIIMSVANETYQTLEVNYAAYGTIGSDAVFHPVPEPTSGLLLVMGLAGLALKRKRA